MPLYDYKCQEHGLFHALTAMDEYADPKPCPECGVLSSRVIVLPPQLFAMDDAARRASEANEKSRHEPVFSTPERRREEAERHAHRHGSGCCHTPLRQSNLFYTADGKKMFPSMRPWMISH